MCLFGLMKAALWGSGHTSIVFGARAHVHQLGVAGHHKHVCVLSSHDI